MHGDVCLSIVMVLLSLYRFPNHSGPRAALFIDMAKAFEKVNPHWAVDVMLTGLSILPIGAWLFLVC